MPLTKFQWTVYVDGQLFDIMTDAQVEELLDVVNIVRIDSERGLILF